MQSLVYSALVHKPLLNLPQPEKLLAKTSPNAPFCAFSPESCSYLRFSRASEGSSFFLEGVFSEAFSSIFESGQEVYWFYATCSEGFLGMKIRKEGDLFSCYHRKASELKKKRRLEQMKGAFLRPQISGGDEPIEQLGARTGAREKRISQTSTFSSLNYRTFDSLLENSRVKNLKKFVLIKHCHFK